MQLFLYKHILKKRSTHNLLFMLFNKLKYYLSLAVVLGSLLLISCHDDDDYSLDNFIVNLATVNQIDSEDNLFYLTLDDGTTLYPSELLTDYKSTNVNQRVFLNYTILSNTQNGYDHLIKINNISNILTKDIAQQDSLSNWGNDPIEIISTWIGDNFVNFRFKIKVGGENKHTVDLVYKPKEMTSDTIRLQLSHNPLGDPAKYDEMTYAAFNLNSLKQTINENTTIVVESIDFKNQKKEYILKYKNTNN